MSLFTVKMKMLTAVVLDGYSDKVVKALLEDEIVLKFYLRCGGAESALRHDRQIARALELWDGNMPGECGKKPAGGQ